MGESIIKCAVALKKDDTQCRSGLTYEDHSLRTEELLSRARRGGPESSGCTPVGWVRVRSGQIGRDRRPREEPNLDAVVIPQQCKSTSTILSKSGTVRLVVVRDEAALVAWLAGGVDEAVRADEVAGLLDLSGRWVFASVFGV